MNILFSLSKKIVFFFHCTKFCGSVKRLKFLLLIMLLVKVIEYIRRTHDSWLINIEGDNFTVLPKCWKTLNNLRGVFLRAEVTL
jgi:hypothetical protein